MTATGTTIDQLPAVLEPGNRPAALTTSLRGSGLSPSLLTDARDQSSRRCIDFFTSNIRNPNSRRPYARGCQTFFAWCNERGLGLTTIRPYNVVFYTRGRQQTRSTAEVKQQLAAVRMLFHWLMTGEIVPTNPAARLRGPNHVVNTGKTPVLGGGGVAQAARPHSNRADAGFPRQGANRHPHLFLRPDHRAPNDERGGSLV